MNPHDAVSNPPTAACRMTTGERRRRGNGDRRVPYRVPCRVRLVDPKTGEVRTVVGETVNISTHGLAVQIGTEVPLGTWVETLVPHPNGEPMFVCGTVVHTRRTLSTNVELGVATDTGHGFV